MEMKTFEKAKEIVEEIEKIEEAIEIINKAGSITFIIAGQTITMSPFNNYMKIFHDLRIMAADGLEDLKQHKLKNLKLI